MKTPRKQTTENYIKEIRRNTRRIFSSEQKIQIVMEALRAEMSVAELCRKYSINESQFYKWNKEFLEAGKKRLSEAALQKFVNRYNNERYHESLNNLTPADIYFGRGEMILKERQKLKKIAIINRRNEYQKLKLTTNQKNIYL